MIYHCLYVCNTSWSDILAKFSIQSYTEENEVKLKLETIRWYL